MRDNRIIKKLHIFDVSNKNFHNFKNQNELYRMAIGSTNMAGSLNKIYNGHNGAHIPT